MLTDYIRFTPLGEIFMIAAMSRAAEAVMDHQAELREEMKDHFINPEAWIACANRWQQAVKEQAEHNRHVGGAVTEPEDDGFDNE